MVERYVRGFSFSAFEGANPEAPKPGAALDTEFASIQLALDAIRNYIGAGEPSQQRVITQESQFPVTISLTDDFVMIQPAFTAERTLILPVLGASAWEVVIIRGATATGAFNLVVKDHLGATITTIAWDATARYAHISWNGSAFTVVTATGSYPGLDPSLDADRAEAAAAAADAAADRAEVAAATVGYRLVAVRDFGFDTTANIKGSTAWKDQAVTNANAFNLARAAAISSGVNGVIFPNTNGLVPIEQCLLPTFSAADNSQTPARPFEVLGVDEWSTQLELAAGSARTPGTYPDALFKHASYGTLTQRATNAFLRIGRMRLQGLGLWAVDAPVAKLDNVWAGDFHDLIVGGNPAGNMLDMWSYIAGGAQTCNWRRIRGMKKRFWVTATVGQKKVLNSRDALAPHAFRYMFGLRGPLDAAGKANNHYFSHIEGYTAIMGYIDTIPYETTTDPDRWTSTAFPFGGGVDELNVDGMFAGSVFTNETETNLIDSVVDQTTINLVSTADPYPLGEWLDQPADMVNYVLKIRNPADNLLYARRIIGGAIVSGKRQVTVSRAFPFTVATGQYYETRCCDAKAFDVEGMHEDVQVHAVRWATRVYRGSLRDIRTEGGSAVARMSYARGDISVDTPRQWSDRSRGFQIFDSPKFRDPPTNSQYIERAKSWAPQYYHGLAARGWEGASAHTITGSVMLADTDNVGTAATPVMIARNNNTGADFLEGGCGRLGTNNLDILNSIAWDAAGTTEQQKQFRRNLHFPITNMTGVPMVRDDMCGVGIVAPMKLLIKPTAAQDIKQGFFVLHGANNMWVAVDPEDPAFLPEWHHIRRGKVIQAYIDGGSATAVLLHCMLGV